MVEFSKLGNLITDCQEPASDIFHTVSLISKKFCSQKVGVQITIVKLICFPLPRMTLVGTIVQNISLGNVIAKILKSRHQLRKILWWWWWGYNMNNTSLKNLFMLSTHHFGKFPREKTNFCSQVDKISLENLCMFNLNRFERHCATILKNTTDARLA